MQDMNTAHQYPPVELYLNSANATQSNQYKNDVTFQLSRPVIAPQGYQLYLQVLSFSTLNNFTVVNNYNNHITINGYDYILAPGNYSIYQLVGVLTGLDPAVICSFDNITLRVTFSSAANITLSGPLLVLLGIEQNSSGTTVASSNIINMAGIQSIYISTNLTSSNPNIDSMSGSDTVLCRVPIATPPGSIVTYIDFNGRSGLLLDDTILTSIQLLLTDENNLPLLCSSDWTITLQARFVYTGWQALQVERPLTLANGVLTN